MMNNQKLMKNIKGNKTELPSYILKVKQQLTNTKSILNDIRETKTSN